MSLTRSTTVTTAAAAGPPTQDRRRLAHWWRRVGPSLPELSAVAVAAFGVVAMILLLLGWFWIPLVLAAGGTAAVLAVRAVRIEPELGPANRWLLATVAVAVLALIDNAWMASQNLYAVRDPSTYLLAGQWLSQHHSLPIPTQPEIFGQLGADPHVLRGNSNGFAFSLYVPGHVDAQGNHLLPALLAVAGWAGGLGWLLAANAFLGALALLAVFGLARRIVGDPMAFAVTTALAVSMPMVAFSRDGYTEPLALLLLAGGMSLLWRAVRSGRPVEFALAGLTTGAVAMDRVDGYGPLLAVVAVATGYAARGRGGDRLRAGARGLLLVGVAAVPAALGYVDVTRLSSDYYRNERRWILPLLWLAEVAVVLAVLVVLAVWRWPAVRRLTAPAPRRVLARLAAVAVVLASLVLVSRPLWQVVYQPADECNPFVPQVQHSLGLPIQPCRTYAEWALHWVAWYFGWPTLVLAVAGLAALVHRTVRRADLRYLGPVLMVVGIGGLYLYFPAITPDQVWASRRYLPVIFPGVLIAAGYAIVLLSRWWGARPAGGGGPLGRVGALPHAVGLDRVSPVGLRVALAGMLVAVPAVITHPMELVRQFVPQQAQVNLICAHTGGAGSGDDDGAVVVVGAAMAGAYTQTIRGICGVPVTGARSITAEQLARIRGAALAQGRHLYVITQDVAEVPWSVPTRPRPTDTAYERRWPTRLLDVPQHPEGAEIPVWIGDVLGDGTVRPLPPPPR